MSADSIPSQCIFCSLPYYRQGDVEVYTMSYFCLHCRTQLTGKQWKLLNKFHQLFLDLEHNQAYWDILHKLQMPSEEVVLAKASFLRKIFESMIINAPREVIFSLLQVSKLSEIFREKILDLIELLEEYDALKKEKLNGKQCKKRKNSKNKKQSSR